MEAAACVAAFMHQLGAKYAPAPRPNAWVPLNFIGFLQSDRWRKDSQVIDFHHDSHDHQQVRVRRVLGRVLRPGVGLH